MNTPVRVTFDTNTLADVVAPESSQRSNGVADGAKVRSAIRAGIVQGFFCETMITLEGIKNVDRTTVFGSTTTNTRFEHGVAPDGNGVTYINMRAEQMARQPLDQRQADRFLAAFQLGMKLLGAPRVGMVRVDDPDGSRYLLETDEDQIGRRLERHGNVVDGDSVAAHYGYDNDFFCTEDFGKGASTASVLDNANRKWLHETFGIRFATLTGLAAMV
jgi:hypothetical protein